MSKEKLGDEKTFENIKCLDEYGNEYWCARELQNVLNYIEWRKFKGVINKAKLACVNSNCKVYDHFVDTAKMVQTGDSVRKILDYHLSRYACYLIVQNSDPRKEVVALGQIILLYTK